MKQTKRLLALALTLAMLLSVGILALTGCNETPDVTDESTAGETTDAETVEETTSGGEETTGAVTPAGKIDYTVTVTSQGGLPLAGVTTFVYSDETLDDLEGYGMTDENGTAIISMKASDSYRIVISGAPEGYVTEESYPFTDGKAEITLTSSVVKENTSQSGVSYKLGSIMRDFTVTDSEGVEYTLSKLLETKKAVVLNFWYTTCSYCVEEFPYMETVYNEYKDDIEILALNHYNADSEASVKSFKSLYGLSFPMAKEALGFQSAFSLTGYPTTVVIDRYGAICFINAGGLPSEEPFRAIFEHFTAEDYKQTLFRSLDELMPIEKPNVQMPASDEIAAALGTTALGITYSPETSEESAEYAWPFLIGEKNGETCIYTSNKNKQSSYAILYANVSMKKGDVLAFDYLASTERGADVMYVLVDRKDIYQISGEGTDWGTCYTYVAVEDGEYEVAFCYYKDGDAHVGEDTVYLKNLRIVGIDDIDVPTYIYRYAATDLREDGFGYETYAELVYNETDGYYHVGSKDGPLLLADLMGQTRFSEESVWALAYNGKVGENFYDEIVDYCSYASNSEIAGHCPVSTELRKLLETVAKSVGIEQSENEWMQMCAYYDAYGTDGAQLPDPILGLSAASAYKAEIGKDNTVTYNRVIMPRGLWYEFVPEKSGVYRITSDSVYEVDGWIFLEDGTEYYIYEAEERLYNDPLNCSMVVYMEAGKSYYIDIAFYDVYQTGTFTFEIEYVAEQLDHFVVASPGYFTYYENEGITDANEIVAGGIDVKLGDDGYYHHLKADGTLGSIVYADFVGYSNIFAGVSLKDMAEKTSSFNFAINESDQMILDYLKTFEKKGIDYKEGFKAEWGDDYDYYMDFHKVEDVVKGIYHGEGKDMTETAKKYAGMLIGKTADAPELEGCVAVTAELAELLQMLMDKFTFRGVDHSWTKLCFYYKHLGA